MKAFISYSKKDILLKNKFIKHIKPICDKHNMSIFDDSYIQIGENWEERIWKEFNNSQIIFLLISVEFMNSDFCFKKEFKKAISRHKKKQALVVPIILEDCAWDHIDDLAKIQVLPGHDKSVKRGYKTQGHAFAYISGRIGRLIHETGIHKKKPRGSKLAKPKLEDYKDSKYKAVFFDLDGTLVRGNRGYQDFRYSWQLVWKYLGFDDSERKKYYRMYYESAISYEDWCKHTLKRFREKGLKQSDFHKIVKCVRLTKNCKVTLGILKKRGFKLTLVSGSIDTFLEAVFPDCYDYFDYIFINKFTYDDSGIITDINITNYDFEGKYDAILKVCSDEKLKPHECVFVGEGRNDISAASQLSDKGGLSIGYPSDLLRDFVDRDVNKDGLQAILDHIFSDDQDSEATPLPERLKYC